MPSRRPTRCLLVYPRFSDVSFWNFSDILPMLGRRYNMQPLGLLTVAALLPPEWDCRLADLNVRALEDADLDWADIVLTGGMITQQLATLDVVRRAKARGKPVAVGGPDATSQPEVYAAADFLVLGEGELSVPALIAAWEGGSRSGRFDPGEAKADVCGSPIPRFDLVRAGDYLYLGVQTSRGCPYTCEFCDIIELYGRVPRVKTPERVLAELEALYSAGYRGHVDFVDDNFIGDKRAAKELLRRLRDWSQARGWPFFFSTEVTLTLGSDPELLELMRACDFHYVFVGIETPDPELLRQTRKRQNTLAPIVESVRRINEAGMLVYAGFILGFDGEAAGAADAVVACVEASRICTALTGLLTALPNTQLERRLARESRLLVRTHKAEVRPWEVDQMTGGLNFLTRRPRAEILSEYRSLLGRLFAPEAYFARVRGFLSWYDPRPRHRPPARVWPQFVRTFFLVALAYLRRPSLLPEYLRTLAFGASRSRSAFREAVVLSWLYLHLERQTRHVLEHAGTQLDELAAVGEEEYLRRRDLGVARPGPSAVLAPAPGA